VQAERIEKLLGQWRSVVFFDEQDAQVSLAYCECLHCGYRTDAGNIPFRREQMVEHEKAHPREREVQQFHQIQIRSVLPRSVCKSILWECHSHMERH
jgi:hypothetical protein